jgi:hypothetical protein
MNPFTPSNQTRGRERKHNARTRHFDCLLAGLAACGLLAGCASPESLSQIDLMKPAYHPDNVFQYTPVLPYDLKRVAVLPLACDESRYDLQDGCHSLDPILQAELIKTKRFEVIPVSCEVLQSRTGQSTWTGAEKLPSTFFDSLREVYGCEGVLFCQLTVYRPYAPLAVGWRMRLVDVRTRQTVWATDELFDASFQKPPKDRIVNPLEVPYMTDDSVKRWSVLNSPREFGRYAAAQIVGTLPAR